MKTNQNLVFRFSVDVPVPATDEGVKQSRAMKKKMRRGIARLQGAVRGNINGSYTSGATQLILVKNDAEGNPVETVLETNAPEMIEITFTSRGTATEKIGSLDALIAKATGGNAGAVSAAPVSATPEVEDPEEDDDDDDDDE